MRLEITEPRNALIIRMRAWAYANVIQQDMAKAQKLAEKALAEFEYMKKENPSDSMGYWANFFYTNFCDECKRLNK